MLIAQVTDCHIGFDSGNPDEYNQQRLDAVMDRLAAGPNAPDVMLATGDLTDQGDVASYARLRDLFAAYRWPVLPCVGNHDVRSAFAEVFPDFVDRSGFVHYDRVYPELRLIVIDTLEEGRHGGAFCEVRAAWLKARLAEQRHLLTYIVMHHPPFDSGLGWMTTDPDEPWVARFADAIAGAPQLTGLICGHLHRSLCVQWRGLTAAVCSSTAPQVALDLRPIDAGHTDDRAMIVAEDPSYALHHWNGEALVSHFDSAADYDVLARYNHKMQDLVEHLIGERPPA
ncbi:MAG: metallophosphoesterase [Sphingopyxis sp.]